MIGKSTLSWLWAGLGMVLVCFPGTPAQANQPLVTFNKDIAPIIFSNCSGCHRQGEVAPFPLLTYADVRRHSKEIAELTHNRQMPPWKPEEGYGDFVGARRISPQQIDLIQQWVGAGKPEGVAGDLPAQPVFKSGWALGEPDMVVKMPEAYTLPADGPDRFHVFVIPLNLKDDVYVSALDFRPSNPKIVHHTLFFLDNSGGARELEEQSTDRPGYPHSGGPGFLPSGGLGGWAPGVTARFLPEGVGRVIHAGADLVLQTHFHPSGKVEREQSSVGLYFTKKQPTKILVSFPKNIGRIDIPAGQKKVLHTSFVVPSDVELEGIFPHAHLVCSEIKVDATLPDSTSEPLIWIKDWDWNWQDFYLYSKVLNIPKGTKVDMTFTYDNTANNPHNPSDPPLRVRNGEQTKDEMGLVFFQLLVDRSQAETFRAFARRFRRPQAVSP